MAEKNSGRKISIGIARYLIVPLIVLVSAASLLPLLETNIWWIRFLDYPRIQFLAALGILAVLYVLLRLPRHALGWLPIVLVAVAVAYNVYRVYPYTPLLRERALSVSECPQGSRLRVLIANVQKTNEQAQRLFEIVRNNNPDLFLAMETDAWWDEHLTSLQDLFPHRIQKIPENHAFFGIHLLSKYPLVDPQIPYLYGDFTPTIFTGVQLPNGTTVSFFGVHPQPPHYWSQPTTMRDAYLLTAALRAHDNPTATIMAGDLNAVPWERTTRRAMRLGGLLDPRVGRGLYPSYDAQSVILSWPLDQILYQDRFALLSFKRLPAFGSDHYPVMADLCYLPSMAERQQPPAREQGDFQEAQTSIEAARKMQPSPD